MIGVSIMIVFPFGVYFGHYDTVKWLSMYLNKTHMMCASNKTNSLRNASYEKTFLKINKLYTADKVLVNHYG